MDFETLEWNVPSDVDQLADSLFGKLPDHKIKKEKTKIQGSCDKRYVFSQDKIIANDQYKSGIISKMDRKTQKMQNRKLMKLVVKHRDHSLSASGGNDSICMMCRGQKVDNFKCTHVRDNGLSSVKRKRSEVECASEYNNSSFLHRKKARACVLLPEDTEKSKWDTNDRNEYENLKRGKQCADTVGFQDNSKKRKKRKRSKKNKFKMESAIQIDKQLGVITSEEGFSTNKNKASNDSLSEMIKTSLDGDVEDKKKRRKSKKSNLKDFSDQKNDKQINSSPKSVQELNLNMKDTKCLTASVPKKKEINPRVNKKSLDTTFSNTPSDFHKNSPLNIEKLKIILDNNPVVRNASKVNISDKGSSIKLQKQSPSSSLSLKEKMLERLSAARFRYLNEQLYTTTGGKAFRMFQEDADSFAVYHAGFEGQVKKWPTNPLDLIIRFILSRPKHLIIADFGCGDAKIARSVPNKVYSFDLAALNEHVTVCNMEKVPLNDSSVDIAVFCLSLMGTNLADYIREAHRVLKNGGILKIAEVQSRFQDLDAFVKKVEMLGFKLTDQNAENKMFIMINFKKSKPVKSRGPNFQLTLHPCIYKKR